LTRWCRRLGGWGVAGLSLVGAGLVLEACIFAAPRYHGPTTDHFDGSHFHNEREAEPSRDIFKWLANRQPGPWSPQPDAPPGPKPVARVGAGQMRVTWINHATALLQMDGLNILTDPIWSERCSPVSFAGPKRVRPPGIRFEDLPPIDVVLISHDHYDHMDAPTLRRLQAAFRPRFVVGLGNAKLLERWGISGVDELDWWQGFPLSPDVRLTSVPAQHFSNRSLTDRNVTLWTGYVLEGTAGAAYFAGDTGFGPHYEEISRRFGPLRLALLPIGAFRPEWFMGPIHMSPTEAVRAHLALHAKTSVAIHFGTFPLADDGETEPVEKLAEALAAQGVAKDAFWALGFGEGRDVPPL
jgi:L-ascorbate metabolism protein UlaG (beta-lactamase superfamily)